MVALSARGPAARAVEFWIPSKRFGARQAVTSGVSLNGLLVSGPRGLIDGVPLSVTGQTCSAGDSGHHTSKVGQYRTAELYCL